MDVMSGVENKDGMVVVVAVAVVVAGRGRV
jgi:hypothetical protein